MAGQFLFIVVYPGDGGKAVVLKYHLISAGISNSGLFLISGLCALWARNCVLVLMPLDRLLPSPLGGAVAVLGCQFSLDSFFVLSFF